MPVSEMSEGEGNWKLDRRDLVSRILCLLWPFLGVLAGRTCVSRASRGSLGSSRGIGAFWLGRKMAETLRVVVGEFKMKIMSFLEHSVGVPYSRISRTEARSADRRGKE